MKSKRVEEETAACMNERKEGLGGWNGAAKGGTQRKRRGIRIGVRREERRGEERERGTEMMPKRPGERGPRSGESDRMDRAMAGHSAGQTGTSRPSLCPSLATSRWVIVIVPGQFCILM